jgi:hypothetical protein
VYLITCLAIKSEHLKKWFSHGSVLSGVLSSIARNALNPYKYYKSAFRRAVIITGTCGGALQNFHMVSCLVGKIKESVNSS